MNHRNGQNPDRNKIVKSEMKFLCKRRVGIVLIKINTGLTCNITPRKKFMGWPSFTQG